VSDEHFSSEPARQARRHLLAHFDDPLAGLSEDDPEVAELVTRTVMEDGAAEVESQLRMSFLQLEDLRIQRELRSATGAEVARLAEARQGIRPELDALMGQTV
jgi:hypothetical protein